MADVTGVSGSYTLPSCGFTEPEGKQFNGWSTSADGSVISGTTYEVSSDTTFYAIWESKEYSIIVTDGKATIGAGSEISKAAQGTTITLTANAAPDGKVFDKWVVESGNTTLEDANSETTTFIMPDSEVSVKATYTIPPYSYLRSGNSEAGNPQVGCRLHQRCSIFQELLLRRDQHNRNLYSSRYTARARMGKRLEQGHRQSLERMLSLSRKEGGGGSRLRQR